MSSFDFLVYFTTMLVIAAIVVDFFTNGLN